jgi:hypothetical protein
VRLCRIGYGSVGLYVEAWREAGGETYSEIEHARLLRSAEVLALRYLGVRVQLYIGIC